VSLNNGNEELSILSADMVLIDHISYASATSGKSRSLDPDFLNATANDDGNNWCLSTSSYHANNQGTPGADNDDCPQ
jgi:hypothetical protein